MGQSALGKSPYRWPFRAAHFWCGLLAGLGVGLLLGAALVEMEVLTTHRKAWASLLGAVLVGISGFVGWVDPSGSQGGAKPAGLPDSGAPSASQNGQTTMGEPHSWRNPP
jgi:hypothetical protein